MLLQSSVLFALDCSATWCSVSLAGATSLPPALLRTVAPPTTYLATRKKPRTKRRPLLRSVNQLLASNTECSPHHRLVLSFVYQWLFSFTLYRPSSSKVPSSFQSIQPSSTLFISSPAAPNRHFIVLSIR